MGQVQSNELTQAQSFHPPSRSPSQPQSATESKPVEINERAVSNRLAHCAYDIDRWYDLLQHVTFKSTLIPLTVVTAQSLVKFYQTKFIQRSTLDTAAVTLIRQLQTDIADAIARDKYAQTGAFVRLSVRSPKDGDTLDPTLLSRLFVEELSSAAATADINSPESVANYRLIAYFNAKFRSMRVSSAEETMNIVLSSERVFVDLNEAIDCESARALSQQNTPSWSTHLVIRQWDSRINPALEFRCFIYHKSLTAITQYNKYCRFPELNPDVTAAALEEQQQVIKMTIYRFFMIQVRSLLSGHYEDCVLDVAVYGSAVYDQCVVIELNPFTTATNAGLFDWQRDAELLRRTNPSTSSLEMSSAAADAIVFRIRRDYLPHIQEYSNAIISDAGLGQHIGFSQPNHSSSVEEEVMKPYHELLNNVIDH